MKVPPSMMLHHTLYVLTLRQKTEKWFQIEPSLYIVTNKQLHILHTYYYFKRHFHIGKYFPLKEYKKTKRSMSREKNASL